MTKAWDNRVGCAVVIDVMKNLQKENHPNIVYGVGAVQEEVGLRGAKQQHTKLNQISALRLMWVQLATHQACRKRINE